MNVVVNRDTTTGNAHGPKPEWVTDIRYEAPVRWYSMTWTSK